MKKLKLILALVVVMALIFPTIISAQVPGPAVCAFYGTVTMGGEAAPDGTEVVALIDGKEVASCTTIGSKYGYKDNPLRIAGDYDGKMVTFTVAGYAAEGKATWTRGESIKRDLTIEEKPPPAPPPPPPPPPPAIPPAGPAVCGFYGAVTLDGKPVPAGTEVVAFIEGKEVARCTTIDSEYGYKENLLRIAGEYDGKNMTFKVKGYDARETPTWARGENIKLDLSAVAKLTEEDVLKGIDEWAKGKISDEELLRLIVSWAKP